MNKIINSSLLLGPQPEKTLFHFDGIYQIFERTSNTIKEINEDQAKAVLDENPDCRIVFIYDNDVPVFIKDRYIKTRDMVESVNQIGEANIKRDILKAFTKI